MESGRRSVAVLTVAAVVLIVAGIAAVAIDSAGSNPSSPTGRESPSGNSPVVFGTPSPSVTLATPSVAPSPSPSQDVPSPSASPSAVAHKPGFVVSGNSIVYYEADGTTVPVQPLAGLRATLGADRVTYTALAGNRYGLRTGALAGEFMPNVATQQADGSSALTGGMVLVGPVVNRLIGDALAAISSPADRWIVALPVDIRGTTKPVDVSFDAFGLHGVADTPRVLVRFTGSLPVVNIIPGNAGFHVLVEGLGVTVWQVIDPTRLALSLSKLDPEHPMNELLIYGNGAPSAQRDVLVDRTVAIGRPMLSAASEVSVSLAVRSSHASLGPRQLLQVGDVPVFVASA